MSGSRIFVVEVSPTVADDGSTLTYLFATEAWATTPTDTPPNTPVRALLRNAGTVRRELFSGARVTGAITPAYGNIVLANPAPVDGAAGELDAWLDYGISGSRVVVRWGEVGAAYPAAWTTVYIAYAHSMIVDTASITIRLRDRLQLLDKPVVTDAFAGTGGVEGNGGVSKKKQFVSSDPGFIPPVLIDANKLIYFLQSTGDGGLRDSWQFSPTQTVNNFDVFDQGVKLTRTAANYSTSTQLLGSAPGAGEVKFWFGPASTYQPSWCNGPVYFRLGSPPAGDLRCYAQGYPNDLDFNLAGMVIGSFTAGVIARRAGVDAASIGDTPLSVGEQMVDDDATYLDLLADYALAVQGWFGFSRLDIFRAGRLLDPNTENPNYGVEIYGPQPDMPSTSVHTFDGQFVSGLRREPPAGMEVPIWKASFRVGRTWPSEVAGAASPVVRDYLKRDPSYAGFDGVSTSTLLANPGAGTATVEVNGRAVQNQLSALVMAHRYLALYGGRRDFWTFSVPMSDDVLALDLHDCVTLQTPRFGLAAGRKHRIVGITLDCAAKVPQIRFTLWGGEAGVWTGGSGGPGTVGWGGGGSGGGTSTAPLLLRNSLGDFTGYMAGSVSTASGTGGDSGGTTAGSIGDFTGYMAGVIVSDAYFADVQLLLHGNGTNGSTTFTDSSSHARTVSIASGSPQISTTQSKFGGASIKGGAHATQLNATLSGIAADEPWTLELWYYRTAGGDYHAFLEIDETYVMLRTPVNSGSYELGFFKSYMRTYTTATVPLNTWTHLACCVEKTAPTNWRIRLFVDGNLDITYNTSDSMALSTGGPTLRIGRSNSSGFAAFDGHIDEYRLTVGAARYTASFTAPTAPYEDS
ncbi:MAG: hypothetical protein KAY54_01680 [Burkholderiaceae bacterium]|nr:hypothetical protein [Vitreoscilla sp.]MBP8100567.1 hypothetical protein [Burkholderiaceae bacterium]